MFFVLIFGILAVVLVVGGAGAPQAQRSPSVRVGLWFFGAAAVLVAVAFLLAEI